jgi:hypothetical protein
MVSQNIMYEAIGLARNPSSVPNYPTIHLF